MKKLVNKSLIILSISLIISASIVSCKKDTDCTAEITVVDSLGNAVSGAYVVLFSTEISPNGNSNLEFPPTITDATGKTTQVIKLEAVLNINATAGSLANKPENDLIKLEAGNTVQKTVTVK